MQLQRAGDNYKVKITDFEGPLDLLLHLIRDAKLDIKTVPLCAVTAQYCEFLKDAGNLNLELASEFIEVGATLMEIKSRNILPHEVEEEDEEDVEGRLRAQLEEYKLIKEASEKLKGLENVDRFYKEPEQLKPEVKFVLDGLSVDVLISAFQRVLFKVEQKAAPITEKQIKLDRFTVADKIKDIRGRVGMGADLRFFDLFGEDFTKSEIINTFLAVLELLKNQEIMAVQASHFADIKIVRGEDYGKHEGERSEFEETPETPDYNVVAAAD